LGHSVQETGQELKSSLDDKQNIAVREIRDQQNFAAQCCLCSTTYAAIKNSDYYKQKENNNINICKTNKKCCTVKTTQNITIHTTIKFQVTCNFLVTKVTSPNFP